MQARAYLYASNSTHMPAYTRSFSDARDLNVKKKIKFATALVDQVLQLGKDPNPIVHRDIKPDNIMMEDNSPRLVDFGLTTNNLGLMPCIQKRVSSHDKHGDGFNLGR